VRVQTLEAERPVGDALKSIAENPDYFTKSQRHDGQIVAAHAENGEADEVGEKGGHCPGCQQGQEKGELDHAQRPDERLNDEVELLFRGGHGEQGGGVGPDGDEGVGP